MEKWKQDAGHGGTDPGAVSHGNIEKVYTLEAAIYVNNRCKELGISSGVTRSSDVTLTNSQRTSLMKQSAKGNSHHFNADGGSGVEVIHSIYSDGKYEHMLIDEFKRAGYPVRPKPVFFRQGSGGKDYYFMHRETGACRVTIIEYDFVDGPQAEKIKDKAYREGMYECVVRAICRDEGVTYKPKGGQAAPAPSPAPTNPTGGVNVQGIGILKVLDSTVLRKQPVYTAEIMDPLKPGGEYIVHDYNNGWYNIGGWVYKDHVKFTPINNLKMVKA